MSTESDASTAYEANFATGLFTTQPKSNTYRVRGCHAFTTHTRYAVRDTGICGGLIFSITDNGDGSYTYLETAEVDQSASQAWSNMANTQIGATAQGIDVGTGITNTAAIIDQSGHTASAALLCYSLTCVSEPGVGTPASNTASVDPTELTWKWNETDQKQFVVTTNMARWYIASASSYEGFNIQIWKADNSEQVLDGIFTTGMIVKVNPIANNEDLTNKSFSITIANSSDLMLYGATASGAQTFYGYGDPPFFNHEAAWTPGFSSGPSGSAAWNDQTIRITGTPNGFYSGSGSRTMYVWVRDGGVLDPVIGNVLSFGAKDGLAFNQWITGLPQLKNRAYSIFYDSTDRSAE
jgi:hypothetical protein